MTAQYEAIALAFENTRLQMNNLTYFLGVSKILIQLWSQGRTHRRPQDPNWGTWRRCRERFILLGGTRWFSAHRGIHRRWPQRIQCSRAQIRTRQSPIRSRQGKRRTRKIHILTNGIWHRTLTQIAWTFRTVI